MNTKPITPFLHGVIDYVFSAVQLIGPFSLGLNANTIKTYQLLGGSFLATNALTDTPVGIQPALSFQSHQKVDAAFLTGAAALTLVDYIRKDKSALTFHLAFLSLTLANYLLTDYKAGSK